MHAHLRSLSARQDTSLNHVPLRDCGRHQWRVARGVPLLRCAGVMAATPRAIGGRKNGGPKGGGRTVGNYTLLETVGQGTFGEVMIAVEKHTRESVAVKVLERDKITDDAARERLVNEIAILNRVHHANLLQLLEARTPREGERVCLCVCGVRERGSTGSVCGKQRERLRGMDGEAEAQTEAEAAAHIRSAR
eukprot:2785029-Pleurochrysis_carterae.AAC.9